MSGHSKWAKIKHAKGAADAKRGKVFSKLAQQITISAKEGGGDVSSNPSLRLLLDKAKAEGLPNTNIQRAINRGLGVGQDGVQFEECVYEGMGPAGVSFVLDVTTDNKNRVVADLRKIFSNSGGNLSEAGSLSWNFIQKGKIDVLCGKMVESEKHGEGEKFVKEDKEHVMMSLMDIDGVLDIEELEDDTLIVWTEVQNLHSVKNSISKLGLVIDSYQLVRISNNFKEISDENLEKVEQFIEELENYSDIQGIWYDIKF